MQVGLDALPYVVAAERLVETSRQRGEPVWIDQAVHDILREHPDCGLTAAELATIIRDLVIERRWSVVN